MADKHFEARVMKELADLRIVPETDLWPAIEKELGKKKKRRWLLWYFLAGVSGIAAFWAYNSRSRGIADTQHAVTVNTPLLTLKNTVGRGHANEKQVTRIDLRADRQKLFRPNLPTQNNRVVQVAGIPGGSTRSLRTARVARTADGSPAGETRQSALLPEEKAINERGMEARETKRKADIALDRSVLKPLKPMTGESRSAFPEMPLPASAVDSAEDALKRSGNEMAREKHPDTVGSPEKSGPAPTQRNAKSNWQWGIAVDAGSAGLRNALIDFSHLGILGNAYYTAAAGNIPSGTMVVVPVVKDQFSFGLQAEAVKRLDKKRSLALFAGYMLFRTRINVGQRVDTASVGTAVGSNLSSGYYYTTGNAKDYTNYYHLLQIGAKLFTDFHLFRKWTMRWEMGAGLDWLFASNGLRYDASGNGKLFHDNSLYNKVQLYGSAGFDFAFGKKPFLYAGPHWQYNFTRLSGQEQHFYFPSFRFVFVLPEKKKKMQR